MDESDLKLFVCWVMFHASVVICFLFFRINFSGTLSECQLGPDLGPNCLQKLSADDKSHGLLLLRKDFNIHAQLSSGARDLKLCPNSLSISHIIYL